MPEKALESEHCKNLWDSPIQTCKKLEHNRPWITIVDKLAGKYLLIDPTCSFDTRFDRKEEEKYNKYSDLKYEVTRIRKMKEVEVIPIMIGTLGIGTVTKGFNRWMEKQAYNFRLKFCKNLVCWDEKHEMKNRNATIPNITDCGPLL